MRVRDVLVVVALLTAGCGSDRRATLPSKTELEAQVGRRLKLQDVTLNETEKGRFTGSGRGEDGKKYEVRLSIAEKTTAWEKLYKKSNGEIETTGGGFDWTK